MSSSDDPRLDEQAGLLGAAPHVVQRRSFATAAGPAPARSRTTVAAALSFACVACVTTLTKKATLTSLFAYPVLLSGLTAVVAVASIQAGALCGWWALAPLRARHCRAVVAIALASVLALAASNVALSRLTVSLQQTLRALAPGAVAAIEAAGFLWARTTLASRGGGGGRWHSKFVYASLVPLFAGPVLVASSETVANGGLGFDTFGVVAGLVSVAASAVKAVLMHDALAKSHRELGMASFIFWIEVRVCFPARLAATTTDGRRSTPSPAPSPPS